MAMHTITVVTEQWFRHEGHGLAETMRDVMHHVLQDLQRIRAFHQ